MASKTFSVGEGAVKLVPNSAGFHEKARRDFRRESLTVDVDLRPKAADFARQTKDKLAREKLTVGVEVTPTVSDAAWRRFEAQAQRRLSGMDLRVPVKTNLDDASFRATQQRLRDLAQNRTSTITTRHRVVGDPNGGAGLPSAGGVAGLAKFTAAAGAASLAVGSLVGPIGALAAGIGAVGVVAGGAGAAGMGALALGIGTVKTATAGVGDALKEAFSGEDPEKLAEAMGKLAPNARAAVTAMAALGAEFKAIVQQPVQDSFFAGLAPQITQLTQYLVPLRDAMLTVTDGFNEGAQSALSFVNSTQGLALVGTLLTNSANMTANLGSALGNLVPGLAAVGAGASQVFGPMTDGIAGAARGLSDFLIEAQQTGTMQAFFTDAVAVAKQLGSVLGQVGGIIGGIFSAAAAGGTNPLAGIVNTLTQIHEWVDSMAGQNALSTFFTSAQAAMSAIVPVFLQIAQVIGTTVAPIIADLATQLGPVLVPAIAAVGEGIAAAGPQLVALGQTLGGFIIMLTPFIPTLIQLAPTLLVIVGAFKAWSAITKTMTAVQIALNVAMSANANPIGLIVIAIAALVAGIVWVATQTTIFQDTWNTVWNAIKATWDVVWGGLKAGFDAFVGFFTDTIPNGVTAAKDWITTKFDEVVTFVKALPGRVTTALSGIWDGLKDGFKSAINWVIEKWNNFQLTFDFPDWLPGVPDEFTISTPDIPLFGNGGTVPMLPGAVAGRDSILAGIMPGEFITPTDRVTPDTLPLLEAIRAGWVPSAQFLDAMLATAPGYAAGGQVGREPYGLPVGSSGPVTVPWVQDMGKRFGLTPSTYAGHQERDGKNKGIDWSGSTANMQRFAEYLASIHGQMEQVIWMNPDTGQQIGVADGQMVGPGTSQPGYYRDDWAGHTDHVHTRQSFAFGDDTGTPAPGIDTTQAAADGLGATLSGSTSGKLTAEYADGTPTFDEAKRDRTIAKVYVVNMPTGFTFTADTTGSSTGGTSSAPSHPSTSTTSTAAPSGADTVPLKRNPDGTYTSTDPEWAKLIARESGGNPSIVQGVQDVNSGGNEASGLFQIAKGTWASNGGTKYAPTAGQATPEEQAEIAAAIFNKSGGSPWGSGAGQNFGREDEAKLRAGIRRGGSAPAGTKTDPVYVAAPTPAPDTTTAPDASTTAPTTPAPAPASTTTTGNSLSEWMKDLFSAGLGLDVRADTATQTSPFALTADQQLAVDTTSAAAGHTPMGIGGPQLSTIASKAPAVAEIGAGIAANIPAYASALAGNPAMLAAKSAQALTEWGARTATDFASYLPEAIPGMLESLGAGVAGPLIGTVNTGMSPQQVTSTVEDVQNRQIRRTKGGRKRY